MNCTSDVLPALKLPLPLYWAVMKCLSAVSPDVVVAAWPVASRGRLVASVVVVLRRLPPATAYVVSVKVTVPVGVAPPLVLVTAAENVSDCPTTVERTSGEEEVRATPTPFRPPSAHKEPPLSVNT